MGSYAIVWTSSLSAPNWLYGEFEEYAATMKHTLAIVRVNTTSRISPWVKKNRPLMITNSRKPNT